MKNSKIDDIVWWVDGDGEDATHIGGTVIGETFTDFGTVYTVDTGDEEPQNVLDAHTWDTEYLAMFDAIEERTMVALYDSDARDGVCETIATMWRQAWDSRRETLRGRQAQ